MTTLDSPEEHKLVTQYAERLIHLVKSAQPDENIHDIAAAMVYSGCFLLATTVPGLHKELSSTAELVYQCLAQSLTKRSA